MVIFVHQTTRYEDKDIDDGAVSFRDHQRAGDSGSILGKTGKRRIRKDAHYGRDYSIPRTIARETP